MPRRKREAWVAFAFLAPNLIGLLVWTLGPTLFSAGVGFTNWGGLGTPAWVGLDNYIRLAGERQFVKSLTNTVIYTAEFVPLVLVTATFMALLFNRQVPGTTIVRAAFFLPAITDFISSAFVWSWIYHLRFGVLNYVLNLVGIPSQAWLGDTRWAMLALVVLTVWRDTGYNAVIILAGLQAVPRTYYEAARVDGASRWHVFRHVTLPLVSPTLFFIITTNIMGSFQVFEQMYVMTEGGPMSSTISMCMYLYQQGFQFLRMGYASAIAWVLFFIVFLVTLVNWNARKRWVYEG